MKRATNFVNYFSYKKKIRNVFTVNKNNYNFFKNMKLKLLTESLKVIDFRC